MLVLSRKVGERIQIGDTVVLTVVECKNGRVRLGFEAPKDVDIYRQELLTEFQRAPYPTADRALTLQRV